MAGTWKLVEKQPSSAVDTMLLLLDGSVMCHQYGTANWLKLAPNAQSDYANGTWSQLASLPANAPAGQGGPSNQPLYFASAVLRDGRVFVAGGEYNAGANVDLLTAQIYDPVTNAWATLPTPAGWANIGDAPTCVLPDGRLIIGNINSTATAIFDPATDTWTAGASKNDTSSEETWTLLPQNIILVADVNAHPASEKYLIDSGTWLTDANVPSQADLVLNLPGVSIEVGPAILMPTGQVFHIGASGHTALYTPASNVSENGTWTAGPDFPKDASNNLKRAFDAPAALLPNGKVLCVAGGVIASGGNAGWAGSPTEFWEFDGTALKAVGGPSTASSQPTFNARLLLLPTGQVLYATCTNQLAIYTPDGEPADAWRPRITVCPPLLGQGRTYVLQGQQLNGLSQAVSYGDDAQMATNYPIVRLRNSAGTIAYLRTFGHSTMAVATGAQTVSTNFFVPPSVPTGDWQLTVVANGIESAPVAVSVHEGELLASRAAPLYGFAAGRMDVFWKATDGSLMDTWWDGKQWQTSKLASGALASDPAPLYGFAAGRMDVFWKATDESLMDTWWDGKQWQTSKLAPGPIDSVPAPLHGFAAGRMDIFWKGKNGLLVDTWWTGSAWETSDLT